MHWSIAAFILSLAPQLSDAIAPPTNSGISLIQPGISNSSSFDEPLAYRNRWGITYNFNQQEKSWPSRNAEDFILSAIRKIPTGYLHEPFHHLEALNTEDKMHFDMTIVSNPPISFSNMDAKNALREVRQYIREIGWSSFPTVKPFSFNVWGFQQGGQRVQVARGSLRAIHIGGSIAFPLQLRGDNSTSLRNAHSSDKSRFTINYTENDRGESLSTHDLHQVLTLAVEKVPRSRAPFHHVGAMTKKIVFNMDLVPSSKAVFTEWDARLVLLNVQVKMLDWRSEDIRQKPFIFKVDAMNGVWPQRRVQVAYGALNAVYPGS